jgi:hypothetical protein
MAQKTKGVAGWGVSAGADQHGRPILMIVGWSVPTTTRARSVYNGSLPSGAACDGSVPTGFLCESLQSLLDPTTCKALGGRTETLGKCCVYCGFWAAAGGANCRHERAEDKARSLVRGPPPPRLSSSRLVPSSSQSHQC